MLILRRPLASLMVKAVTQKLAASVQLEDLNVLKGKHSRISTK